MSVSKRNGSKYFYIQFQYNGKTYIKSSKTPDKQLALNLEAQWRKQLIEQNQLGLKSPIEVTKGFPLFVKSKSHIKSIKYTIHWCDKASNHFKHLLYVHQITPIEIDRFRQLLQSNNYSNQSIKHVMNQVGGMIKYMRKLGYQVSEVEMPSIKLPKGRLKYLSIEEEQRLLRAADPTREIKYVAPYDTRRVDIKNQMQDFYDLLILLLDTGARHVKSALLSGPRSSKRHVIEPESKDVQPTLFVIRMPLG